MSGGYAPTPIYSPTSWVVFARGSTGDATGLGTNKKGSYGHNIATSIASGASIGDAILSHVDTPLISPWLESREGIVAVTVFLGDPSIRLRA